MHARLSEGHTEGPCTVALHGLGGVGKTTVAVEYTHRHLAEFGVAWQFAAEEPTVLAAGFAELAAQLGARDLFDARDPIASVHAVLAAYPSKWLLLFNNVPDFGSVQGFLPPAGSGWILITSRSPHWPSGQSVEVPPLDHPAASDFLFNRAGDTDRPSAEDLATELGGLPLALEQAAAFLEATGSTLSRYLEAFRQRRSELLARGRAVSRCARPSPPPGNSCSTGSRKPDPARLPCCGSWHAAHLRTSRCIS